MLGSNVKVHFAGSDGSKENFCALVAADTRYRLYSNVPNGAWLDTRTLRYWGLTRLGVSFIYKLPQP